MTCKFPDGTHSGTHLIDVMQRHIQLSIPATDVMFASHPKTVEAPDETVMSEVS